MVNYTTFILFAIVWITLVHCLDQEYSQVIDLDQEINIDDINDGPVIAILTWEFDIMNTGIPVESVPSTYTNMLESAGARTVPLSFKWSKEKMYEVLDKVNGVLYTGGDIIQYDRETEKLHPYYLATEIVTTYVTERNNKGDHFPLFGICQGFQSLMMYFSGDPAILSDSIRWGANDTIFPFNSSFQDSNMLKSFDINSYTNPTGNDEENIEFNWHQFGIYLSQFYESAPLSATFNLLSYDDYGDGKPIVATIEAFKYPIIATQYHPEKNLYDYLNPSIPHTRKAQQFTEDLAYTFVEEWRKNNHSYESYEEEVKAHINNYRRYFGLFEHDGDNVYIDYYVFEDKLLTE